MRMMTLLALLMLSTSAQAEPTNESAPADSVVGLVEAAEAAVAKKNAKDKSTAEAEAKLKKNQRSALEEDFTALENKIEVHLGDIREIGRAFDTLRRGCTQAPELIAQMNVKLMEIGKSNTSIKSQVGKLEVRAEAFRKPLSNLTMAARVPAHAASRSRIVRRRNPQEECAQPPEGLADQNALALSLRESRNRLIELKRLLPPLG